MILPPLLLQKLSQKSKSKDHVEVLKRRLLLWHKGDILELFEEDNTIQTRFKTSLPCNTDEALSKKFSALMKSGKNVAIKLLTSNMEGGILPLNDETMTLLAAKHP